MDAVLSRPESTPTPRTALEAFQNSGKLPPVHVGPEARRRLYAIVEVSRGPMVELVAAGLGPREAKVEAANRNLRYERQGVTVRAFACPLRGLLDPDGLRAGLTSVSAVYGDALRPVEPRRVPR